MSTQDYFVIRPQEIVERALASSSSRACVVIVSCRSVANMRWARTTLTTNGETSHVSVSVIALVDVEGGVAAGSITGRVATSEDIDALVVSAEEAAHHGGPAEDARELVTAIEASADWDDAPEEATSAAFTKLAPDLGAVFSAARADDIEHFGYAEQAIITTYLGTSTGVRLRFAGPEARLELTAKSHGRSRSVWAGRADRTCASFDLGELDRELRQRLQWQGNRIEVASGRHDALLTPSATADLMIDLYWNSIARPAHEGRSVWSRPGGGTRVGELVGDPRFSLSSDPAMPGLEASPFVATISSSASGSVFDNGSPIGATKWIDHGVLSHLITSRFTAEQASLEFRPDAENVRVDVEGSHGTLDEVIARTDDALLVTCLWYNRVVDPQTLLLTGLTRDGVYVVRDGEVIGAATNFRFNDSPVGILSRIVDAGATVPTLAREMGDYFNRAAMPPMRIRDFNFSTVSRAN